MRLVAEMWVAAATVGLLQRVLVRDQCSRHVLGTPCHQSFASCCIWDFHARQRKQLTITSLWVRWPADTSAKVDLGDLQCISVISTFTLKL